MEKLYIESFGNRGFDDKKKIKRMIYTEFIL